MLLKYSPDKEREICSAAARALADGKLVVYPTDTVYGLAADATNASAVDAVFQLKQRPRDQPLSILVSDLEMLFKWTRTTPEQDKLLSACLFGPYTFVLRPVKPLPVSQGNIGFRLPSHWCCGIAKALGRPITATSANIHGQQTPKTIQELEKLFGDKVALYIDAGSLTGKPSKVVDLTTGKTLRE